MSTVRTILGELPPEQLGVTDSHDHLFLAMPRLAGQELDDPEAAEAELRAFTAAGGTSVIHWTPYGLGRRGADLVTLSKRTGVHIVAATGLHQSAHYPEELLARIMPRLDELFVRELTEGLEEAPEAKAGMIKVAGGFHGLDAHARATLTAAASAHHATGAPIGVHHELGTAAPQVLDLLCCQLGVRPERVILGHLNRNPDLREQAALARSGAFLAFDGPSRANHATDSRLLDELATLADAGYAGQLLLGGDTVSASMRSVGGKGPGMPFLLRTLRPRVATVLGDDAAACIFRTNPARAFAF
jgi:phosphotriesterase-related protein